MFLLALPIRILEVKPLDQALVLALEELMACRAILSQMLALGCLVCSMGVPSESHLLGPGMAQQCCQMVKGQSLAFLGTRLVAPGRSLDSSGLPAAMGAGVGTWKRWAMCLWLAAGERGRVPGSSVGLGAL